MTEDYHLEQVPNHGRGFCRKVVVVYKLDMVERLKKLHCIAQNPEVARGVRERFAEEARSFGIEPRYYVTFQEYPVVWSRSIFTDRYRLLDKNTGKLVWSARNKSGEFVSRKAATMAKTKHKKNGTYDNLEIQYYNRRHRRWETSEYKKRKIRLSKLNEVTFS